MCTTTSNLSNIARALKVFAALLLTLLALGCSQDKARTSSPTPKVAPADPWIVTNLDPTAETPALLWNGLIGVRINPDGFGAGNTFFDITRYQPGGEEKIIPIANPLSGEWSIDYETLKPGADYQAKLDLNFGALYISWSQEAKGKKVVYRTAIQVDPDHRIIRQIWRISGPTAIPAWFHQDGLTLTSKALTKDGTYARYPIETDGLVGEVRFFAQDWSADQLTVEKNRLSWKGAVWKDQVYAERIISLAPKGQPLPKPDPAASNTLDYWLVAQMAETPAPQPIPTTADIEIDGPVEDQQFIRSALYYLRGSIHPKGKMSVSPMALSSDVYNGHIFWDADIWVFPALALIDPERAKAITDYRYDRLPTATRSFYTWVKEDRPIASGKMGHEYITGAAADGVMFPWESSVSGKETVPGPSRFQHHIGGSIAFGFGLATALGIEPVDRWERIQSAISSFYLLRLTPNAKEGAEIKSTMSPDEHHTGDNDLYTNLLATWVSDRGTWSDGAKYKLPKDDKTFLTYDNDGLRGYKQAAAVLSIYPLQYPPAEKQAKAMMERFADKVTKNGPAMSDSIHALIWARLGEQDKAYKAWHDSWKPFVKPPFLLFSEKRSSSRTYFTTGAAGSLQAVLYGFAGLRLDDKVPAGSKWSMPLKNGKFLSIKPNLPKEWKKLTLRNLTVLGKRLTFEIEGDQVKVTEARL